MSVIRFAATILFRMIKAYVWHKAWWGCSHQRNANSDARQPTSRMFLAGLKDLHLIPPNSFLHRLDVLGAFGSDDDLFPQAQALAYNGNLDGLVHLHGQIGENLSCDLVISRPASLNNDPLTCQGYLLLDPGLDNVAADTSGAAVHRAGSPPAGRQTS
jgi:hypothetical protein